ncbi:MAG TPA: hypothetical protein DCS15_04200 [Flavobacteriales bacterium]|nr:hypothetical protein [Flavobacteriales bacterium]
MYKEYRRIFDITPVNIHSTLRTIICPYYDYGEEEISGEFSYDKSFVNFIKQIVLCELRYRETKNDCVLELEHALSVLIEDIINDSLDLSGSYFDENLEFKQLAEVATRQISVLRDDLAKIIFESSVIQNTVQSIIQDLSLGRKSILFAHLQDVIDVIVYSDPKWMASVVRENFPVFVHSKSKFASSLVEVYTPELFVQLEEERLAIINKAYSEMLQSRVKNPEDPSEGRPISSKDEAIEIAGQNVLRLKLLSDDLKQDRSFVRSLITEKGEAISPFREEYGDDEELVLLALKSFKDALLYCSPRLRNSVSFATKAIEIRGATYRIFSDSVRDNEDVCRAAVRKSKGNFKYLPVRMQELDSMRSLVGLEPVITNAIEAERMLREDGSNFRSLSHELRRNPELIVLAAKEHPSILNSLEIDAWTVELCTSLFKWELRDFEFLPKALKEDGHFLQKLIPLVPEVLTQLSWKLRKDMVLQDLANWGNYPEKEVERCASMPNAMLISSHWKNLRFVEAVLSRNGMALEFCEPNVQNDEAFVRVAMDQNPEALKWASQRLQKKLG